MDKDLSFEQAYKKLEEIAEKLESPDVSLEESIALFEEGVKLSARLNEMLEAAKQKIELLERDS